METTTDTKNTMALFDRANSQLKNTLFQQSHHHYLCIFCQWWTWVFMLCSQKSAPVETHSFTAAMVVSLLKHSTHNITVLTSTVWCLSVLSKHRWISTGTIFPIVRKSVTHLWFICTFISDAILSDCPSAAICHTTTTCNEYWWEGSDSTAVPSTFTSDVVGHHHKIVGITSVYAWRSNGWWLGEASVHWNNSKRSR